MAAQNIWLVFCLFIYLSEFIPLFWTKPKTPEQWWDIPDYWSSGASKLWPGSTAILYADEQVTVCWRKQTYLLGIHEKSMQKVHPNYYHPHLYHLLCFWIEFFCLSYYFSTVVYHFWSYTVYAHQLIKLFRLQHKSLKPFGLKVPCVPSRPS